MAIAAVVPHYLLGLAAGAGLLGMFMPIAGYVIPITDIPKPFWRYPMHYLGYHTYSLNGMMANEFLGTSGWGCPCEIQPRGCGGPCSIKGEDVLQALRWAYGRDKWRAPIAHRRLLLTEHSSHTWPQSTHVPPRVCSSTVMFSCLPS